MTSIQDSRRKVKQDFQKKFFMKIFILLKKRKVKLSVISTAKSLGINLDYLAEVIEAYREYFEISLEGEEKELSNMFLSINGNGDNFFYHNIEDYLEN